MGNKTDKTYKQQTNLPLDIIPEEHPYTMAKDETFKVKILFKRKALATTKVKVWHRLKARLTQTDYTTNEDGEIKFFLSPTGRWMVSVVKMERLENDPRADWQSYWGSLTWGY